MTSSKEQLVPVEQIEAAHRIVSQMAIADFPGADYDERRANASTVLAALRTPPAVEPDEGLVEKSAGKVTPADIDLASRLRSGGMTKHAITMAVAAHRLTLAPSIRAQALDEVESKIIAIERVAAYLDSKAEHPTLAETKAAIDLRVAEALASVSALKGGQGV